MSNIFKSVLILVLGSSCSNTQTQFSEASKIDQPRSVSANVSKSILLYRSLMLQDFDQTIVEQIYGTHGQSWIKEKLKLGADSKLFLSTGFSKYGERRWRAPDPALVTAIGLERVKSVNEARDGDLIVIVENVDWVNEDLVSLDISTYHPDLGGGIHGSVEVGLEFKNSRWIIFSNGGCQMRRLRDAE
ncbi:MAG: hypothetical protein AAFU85_05440 [Planctomycetota bacterium]